MRIDAMNQHHFPWTVKKHKLHLKHVLFIYLYLYLFDKKYIISELKSDMQKR